MKEINDTLKDRIDLMQEVAEKQDEELTGGEKGKILAYKREQTRGRVNSTKWKHPALYVP